MSRSLTLLLSIILALLLVFSWILIKQFAPRHSDDVPTTDRPDTFVTDATYLHFDQNGQLQSKIHTTQMVHYTQHNRSEFTAPQLTIYQQDHTPWYITADHGMSQFGTQEIALWGNVKLQHPSQGLTFLTSVLNYWPQQQLARTDQPVTIIEPGIVVNSQGLQANLKAAEIHLTSQVKARYELTTNH